MPAKEKTPAEKYLINIRRRHRKDPYSIEVEQILRFAKLGDPDIILSLRATSEEFGWLRSGLIPGSNCRKIPLGRWIDTICCFLSDGYSGLVQRALDPAEIDFHIRDESRPCAFELGVLKELKNVESIQSILEIESGGHKYPDHKHVITKQCFNALNLITHPKHKLQVNGEPARKLLDISNRYLENQKYPDGEPSRVYNILATVGDGVSLEMLVNVGEPPQYDRRFLLRTQKLLRRRLNTISSTSPAT